jgi:hypothetical protein
MCSKKDPGAYEFSKSLENFHKGNTKDFVTEGNTTKVFYKGNTKGICHTGKYKGESFTKQNTNDFHIFII